MSRKQKMLTLVNWLQFVSGLIIGYLYRALPLIIFYIFATALILALWNGFLVRVSHLPFATVVDAFVFCLVVRIVGMVWRGDKNPLVKTMRVEKFYE